jgi:hypothetical protein
MNTHYSEIIDNWEIEIPFDFATTRSNITPPSYSSTSSIPSISEETLDQSNSPIQFIISDINLTEMGDNRRNNRRNNRNTEDENLQYNFEQPNDNEEGDNNRERNPEQEMTAVLNRLGDLLRTMNGNNNRPQREIKLVDIPTFRAGVQDPMTWLVDFQDACVANHINEER